MKKAVLFDYDGVFANTMGDMYKAWKHSFSLHKNIEIFKQEFFLMEGYTAKRIAEELCNKYKVDKKDIDIIIKDKENYYFKNNKFKLFSGIKEIIDFIKRKGLKVAIVSGAPKSRIKKMIGTRLFNKFDAVIGAGDAIKSKPYPDPYEKVLEIFKILPKEAIVIENAPLGIQAAKAAGIYCVAVESTLNEAYLKNSDIVVKDIQSLLLRLKKIL